MSDRTYISVNEWFKERVPQRPITQASIDAYADALAARRGITREQLEAEPNAFRDMLRAKFGGNR